MIGVERERRILDAQQPMGLRSFLLFALLGAIAGSIKEPLVSLGLVLFAACATLIGYFRATRFPEGHDYAIGLTTEIAAMATFGLGYFCNTEPILSLALGVIMLLVLLNKPFLHTLTKERLKPEEVQAAATLLLLAVGIIPLLPDHTIDPLNIFNPRRLGIIIALVAGIQFLGYAVSRILGQRIGMPLSGFLAGNISSTAALASYPRLAEERPGSHFAVASAATFAIVASLCSMAFLLAAISWQLAFALLMPLLLLVTICIVFGIYVSQHDPETTKKREALGNPLSIISAIKLGTLLTALILVVELSQRFAGDAFTKVITFLGALFELQGVAVASANMFENGTVNLNIAANMIMLAVVGSLVSKVALTALLGRGKYRRLMLSITITLLFVATILSFLIRLSPVFLLKFSV